MGLIGFTAEDKGLGMDISTLRSTLVRRAMRSALRAGELDEQHVEILREVIQQCVLSLRDMKDEEREAWAHGAEDLTSLALFTSAAMFALACPDATQAARQLEVLGDMLTVAQLEGEFSE